MTTKHVSRLRHALTIVSGIPLTAGLLVALAACDLSPKSGPLALGADWQKTCPADTLAAYVTYDISASSSPQPFGGGSVP